MRRRLPVLSTVGLLVLLGPLTLGANKTDPAEPAIRVTVRGAIEAIKDGGTYKDTAWTSGRLGSDAVANMHATLDRRLSNYLTGPALTEYAGLLHTAIDRDSDGDHVIVTAGGVSQIEFDTVEVNGDTATASGRASVWITWVIHRTDVSGPHQGRPSGWETFTTTLERRDGTWYVSSINLEPVDI